MPEYPDNYTPAGGRLYREDGTTINVADLLVGIASSLGGDIELPASSRLVSVNPTGGEAGTGSASKTFASPCLELEVYNNSEANTISFTCGTFAKTLLPKQGWYGPLASFTTVAVTAPTGSPWTVNAQTLETS